MLGYRLRKRQDIPTPLVRAVGGLVTVLLDQGQLPCSSTHSQALRCREKGKPAASLEGRCAPYSMPQKPSASTCERRA
jgi:hypothetical protein